MIHRAVREFRRGRLVDALPVSSGCPDAAFDRFVQQAATSFAAPYALISIVDGGTLWPLAAHGIDLRAVGRRETICDTVLDSDQLLEVCNVLSDERFCALPAVLGEPAIRYYLGASLRAENGLGYGALCVLDTQPRAPASADQRAYLEALARRVVREIDAMQMRSVRISA